MTTDFSRRLAVLLVSSCVAAGPALSQELIVGHTDAPASKLAGKLPAVAEEPEPLPSGAPTDDYEFMGWCTGILTGHMDLYTKVKPQLSVISKRWNSVAEDDKQEAEQQIEGRKLLVRFRGVMAKAEAQKPSLGPTGQASVKKGLDNWSKIDTVDKQAQAYSWMNFGLPVQCETKVASLEKTPIRTTKTAAVTPAKATAAAPAKPKSLAAKLLGDPNTPPSADGKQPLVAQGHLAPYGKSVVGEMAAERATQKAKAASVKKDQKSDNAVVDAGLRP
jgi:hypothetical protein